MAAKIKKRMIDDIIDKTDYAFQPIVSVHSGILMAVEALIRNYETVGFETIEALFDVAYEKKLLYRLDLALRGKALEKYKTICIPHEFKLFYNIDNRVLLMPDYEIGNTTQLLKDHNLQHNLFCFEISEKAPLVQEVNMKRILTNYKNQNFFIAVDDYGAGFSGLMQLYKTEPHFIKIDRFFIQGINLDVRKKKFVASMVNLAHIIGVQVIAEGVETMEEFVACREIGCEYVQGNFVQKPQTDVNEIRVQYDLIEHIAKKEQRQGVDDRDMILLEMSRYEPIVISESTTEDVLNYFRRHSHKTFVPVVNRFEEPVGIIQEMILKKYVYSPYGKELLRNRKSRENVYDLVSAAPACELSTNVENIIELYNKNKEGVGILLTDKGKYRGFLTARALLKLINQKNVAFARNQNPLTKLPGNTVIAEKISLLNDAPDSVVCYFDFDFFKPFNDKYGFRTGDRAIIMFADILNMYSTTHNCFVGHIGGDDFVMIEYGVTSIERVSQNVSELIVEEFRRNVENLYSDEDRARGHIEGVDRFGIHREFPLLRVSCVIANVKFHRNPENIPLEIAEKKKEVKSSPEPIIVF